MSYEQALAYVKNGANGTMPDNNNALKLYALFK